MILRISRTLRRPLLSPAFRTGAGAASSAACTNVGEADGAGVRWLALVAWRLLGLCITSMSLSENPWRSGMDDGSTKGNLSSKISTSLWYAISPVLRIQTLTSRGQVAWQPRKIPHTSRAPLDVSVTRGWSLGYFTTTRHPCMTALGVSLHLCPLSILLLLLLLRHLQFDSPRRRPRRLRN